MSYFVVCRIVVCRWRAYFVCFLQFVHGIQKSIEGSKPKEEKKTTKKQASKNEEILGSFQDVFCFYRKWLLFVVFEGFHYSNNNKKLKRGDERVGGKGEMRRLDFGWVTNWRHKDSNFNSYFFFGCSLLPSSSSFIYQNLFFLSLHRILSSQSTFSYVNIRTTVRYIHTIQSFCPVGANLLYLSRYELDSYDYMK